MELSNFKKGSVIWMAPEYRHEEKTNDWYWALGIIVVCGSIVAFLYENYFFVGVLLLGGILMGYLASRTPEETPHELGPLGLSVQSNLIKYEDMVAFWIIQDSEPLLILKTKKVLTPHLSIPIESTVAKEIEDKLNSMQIKSEEMKTHPFESLMQVVGF